MKKIFLILSILFSVLSFAQSPTGSPQPMGLKWYQAKGYLGTDSGFLVPRRDTNFTPRQPMLVYWEQAGVDSLIWLYNNSRWVSLMDGASARALIRAGSGISYDSTTGTVANTHTVAPFALKHQTQFATNESGSNLYFSDDLLPVGKFIYNDAQLERAKDEFTSFEDIFSTWKRISHGGSDTALSNTIPRRPNETNTWEYDDATDRVSSTINSTSVIGFVSPKYYNNYIHSLTMAASESGVLNDNDFITTIIAYVEDEGDMVVNNAYGLDSGTYPDVNVTDSLIPNQHTIHLIRGRNRQHEQSINDTLTQYAIVYDYGKSTQQLLANGDDSVWVTTSGYGAGQSVDVIVERAGDTIRVRTSEWSDAPSGKGSPRYELEINLADLDITQKFRGGAAYGYGALSQENATFYDVSINVGDNTIYDVRADSGFVWEADSNGDYAKNLDRNFFTTEKGIRRLLYNPYENILIYINDDESYEVITDTLVIHTFIAGTGVSLTRSNDTLTIATSGLVPTARTITINGTTQDLSDNRTFNVYQTISTQTHTAGATATIGNNSVQTSYTMFSVNPASTLASLEITLPATYSPDILYITFGGTVTSGAVVTNLTITPNSGWSLFSSPTTANAGDVLICVKNGATWFVK